MKPMTRPSLRSLSHSGLIALMFAACAGTPTPPATDECELEPASPAQVNLQGVSQNAFNAISSVPRFAVAGAPLPTNPETLLATVNDAGVSPGAVNLSTDGINLGAPLKDGLNTADFTTQDTTGKIVSARASSGRARER